MAEYVYKGRTYKSYNDLMVEKYRRVLWVRDHIDIDNQKEFNDRFIHIIDRLHSRGIMVNGKDMTLNTKTSPW